MARRASRSSSTGAAELCVTKGALDQRWEMLGSVIANALSLPMNPSGLRIDAEYASERVWVGFQGGACERIDRNQGGSTWVAPICDLPRGLVAWLGWQEVWELLPTQRKYRFRNTGLTVYVGKRHEATKPQLLRLEWPGLSNWAGADIVSFQSPGAGHPHWQIDLLQSLAFEFTAKEFEPNKPEVLEDFELAMREPASTDLIRRLSIERMHLASAAPWWLPPTVGDVAHHMNAPEDAQALSRWLGQSITYLRQELARCIIHA